MNIERKRILKFIITGCIIFMIIFAIINTKKVYAYNPQGKLTMSLSRYEAYVFIDETTKIEFYVSKSPVSIYWGLDDKNIVDAYYRNKTQHVTITGRRIGTTTLTIQAVYSQNDYATVKCKIHVIPINTNNNNNISVSLSQDTYRYDGNSYKPNVYAYYKGYQISSSNYDIIYPSDTRSAGWKSVTVVFKGKYTGRKHIQYRILGIPADQVSISLSKTSYTYDGNVHRPTVTLYAKGWKLTEGTSYTLSWGGNGTNAGTYRVTANLKGNFEGYVWHTYTINKANIANADIRHIEKSDFIYNGGSQSPEFRVYYYGSKALGYADFTYSFPRGDVTAGEKVIRIEGRGNYYGYKNSYYTIKKRNIAGGSITLNQPSYTYYGGQIKPGIKSVKLANGKTEVFDYKVEYGANKNAGTGWVKVTGTNNNTGSIVKYFTINKRDISKGYVTLNQPNYTYYGGQIKPGIKKVTLSNGTTQVYDYKVEYGANKNAGTGWVKIQGTGNNVGTIYKYFTINKRDVSEGKIELKKSYDKKKAITKDDIEAVYTKSGTKFYDYKIVNSYLNNNKTKATITIEGTGNNTGRIIQTFNLNGVDAFLAKAAEIQEYMYKNNYTYGGDLTINYKDSQTYGKKGYHHVVCATLVSWSLIESGIMEPWELQQESDNAHQASVSNFNHTKRFEEIYHPKASDIKAGDIIIYGSDHHHVEIAADDGRNYVFNAGGNDAITGKQTYLDRQKNYSVKSGSDINDIDVILRLK